MSKSKLSKLNYAHKDSLQDGRFYFIDNLTLRQNISIYVQYITFLVSLDEEYDVGIITYSIFKDIVTHTAHVVESLLHYKIGKIIDYDPTSALLGYEERIVDKKLIHECQNDGEKIYSGILKKEKAELEDRTRFQQLNRAGKRSGLLTKELFENCEEIRKMRNKIHLAGLKRVDDQYTKADISSLFKMTEKIIDRVRDYEIE